MKALKGELFAQANVIVQGHRYQWGGVKATCSEFEAAFSLSLFLRVYLFI